MHGEALNIAKGGFKYSWLDGYLDEHRDEFAALAVEGGWEADFRKKAKDGGQRSDADKKWMKASQVNIFFDGKSAAREEGSDEKREGGLMYNVISLCDIRYLQARQEGADPLAWRPTPRRLHLQHHQRPHRRRGQQWRVRARSRRRVRPEPQGALHHRASY